MAYGAKYRHARTDALGQLVEVFFDKEDFVGSLADKVLGPGGYHRSDSLAETDELVPTRASIGRIPIPAVSIDVMSDVYSDEKLWRFRVLHDGAPHAVGMISKTLRDLSLEPIPESNTLIGHDGLGWLATEDFLANDGTVQGLLDIGPQPWIYWVLFILNKLDFQLPVATCSVWFTPQMTATPSPLLQEYVDPGNYVRNDEPAPTCLYVLRDLIIGKLAFIHQLDGMWHIYQRGQFAYPTFPRTIFSYNHFSGGPAPTTDVYSAQITLPKKQWHKKNPFSPMREAFSAVKVNYDHGAVVSIVENPGFQKRKVDEGADGWTLSGGAKVDYKDAARLQRGGVTLNRALFLPAINTLPGLSDSLRLDGSDEHATRDNAVQIAAGQQFAVSPRLFLELTAAARANAKETGTFRANALITHTLTVGGAVYYLKHDPDTEITTWTTTKSRCVFLIAPESWQNPVVLTPAVPGAGSMTFRVESVVETGPLGYAYKTAWLIWDDFNIFPNPDGEDISTSRTSVIDYAIRGSGALRETIVVRHGTGPTSSHKSATTDSTGALLSDWKIGPYVSEPDSGLTAADMLAHQALVQTRLGNRVINSGFLAGLGISCIKALVIDGDAYLPCHLKEGYETREPECILIEVREDEFTPDFDALSNDGAQFLAGPTGSGVQHLTRGHEDSTSDLAVRNALAITSADIGPGIISLIPVDVSAALAVRQVNLEEGKTIIIGKLRGGHVALTMASDQLPGTIQLQVIPFDLGTSFIPKGSGVFKSEAEQANTSTLTRDATYNLVQQGSLALLTENVNGADITSLMVSALREQIQRGDAVAIKRKDASIAANVWITVNAPKGAKRIHVNAVEPVFTPIMSGLLIVGYTLDNPVPVVIQAEDGSSITRSDVHEQTQSLATSSGFTRTVTRAEFDALAGRVEQVRTGPVQELTDTLGDPVLVNGDPIQFAKRLELIVPEHAGELVLHGSAIQQNDDNIALVVAGVNPSSINLATINVRVGNSEASITSHTSINTSNGFTAATNITQRVDTIGARTVVSASALGGGVFSLAELDLEAGTGGSIARLTGDQIELNGNTTILGSFVVNGANVELNANTTINGNFVVSGGNVELNANTTINGNFVVLGANVHITSATVFDTDVIIKGTLSGVDGSFSGDLTGNNMNITGTLKMNDGVTNFNISSNGTFYLKSGLIGDLTFSGRTISAPYTPDPAAGEFLIDGQSVRLKSNSSITLDVGAGSWVDIDGADVVTEGSRFGNELNLYVGNDSGDVAINNGTVCTNLNADELDGYDAGNLAGQVPISNGVLCVTLNADKLDGLNASNASGDVPISNGTLCTNLNADKIDGLNTGNASGDVPISNGTLCTNLNADKIDGFHAGNASGDVAISNGTICTNLNADKLDGYHAGNASGDVPISNGTICTNLNAEKVGGWAKADLIRLSDGINTNASTAMPNYTATMDVQDSGGTSMRLYGVELL